MQCQSLSITVLSVVVESTGDGVVGGNQEDRDTTDTGTTSRDEDYHSRPESRTDTVTTATPGEALAHIPGLIEVPSIHCPKLLLN